MKTIIEMIEVDENRDDRVDDNRDDRVDDNFIVYGVGIRTDTNH